MTFVYYMDVEPFHAAPSSLQPYMQHPGSVTKKSENAVRYKVTITVPDPMQPDAEADVQVEEADD